MIYSTAGVNELIDQVGSFVTHNFGCFEVLQQNFSDSYTAHKAKTDVVSKQDAGKGSFYACGSVDLVGSYTECMICLQQ